VTGNWEIYRMPAEGMTNDGATVEPLTRSPALDRMPSVSPDGRHIASVSDRDGNHAVCRMDADGSNVVRLTRTPEAEIMILDLASGALTRLTENTVYDRYPGWLPDGRHALYASEVDGVFKLFRLPVAGGEPEQLTFGPRHDRRATVSADGSRILFNREIDGSVEIWEMPVPPVRRSP
jgi:TolB protein